MTCDAEAGVAGTTRKAIRMTLPVRVPGHKPEPKGGSRCHDKHEKHGHCKPRKPKHCKHHHKPKPKRCH